MTTAPEVSARIRHPCGVLRMQPSGSAQDRSPSAVSCGSTGYEEVTLKSKFVLLGFFVKL